MEVVYSVVIPTCNRNEMLALCLDKLMPGAQILDSSLYEVIVTDDSKHNGAKELLASKYPWAKWINAPQRGPAANRNNGAKAAKGRWLVFTDDDCLPNHNWLSEYSKAIEIFPNAKAFEGAVLPDDWTLLKKDMAECPVNDKGGCFWSANIMVQRDFFWSVGAFDEHYKVAANEDQALFMAVKKKSQVPFILNSIVIHPVRTGSVIKKIITANTFVANWLMHKKNCNAGFIPTIVSAIKGELSGVFVALKHLHPKSLFKHLFSLLYWIILAPYLYFNIWRRLDAHN